MVAPTDQRSRRAAFEAVFRAESPGLRRLAHLMTGEAETAEELVQEVFAEAWPRWASFENPGGYVRQGVVNRALIWRRRAGRERSHADPPAGVSPGPPDVDEMWGLLTTLPPDWRYACG